MIKKHLRESFILLTAAGRMRRIITLLLLVFVFLFRITAEEFSSGQLRLILHEDSGRFSLYAISGGRPQSLFADQDPRTSFLSVLVNDRSYRMGDSSTFRVRLGQDKSIPSFVFESAFMIVTMEFYFINTLNIGETNALGIRINMENRGERQINAGARFLLDTNLGENVSPLVLTTNKRTINSEVLIVKADSDNFWTDRNDRLSLTGSVNTGSTSDPDSVHIANWKKLSDVSWKAPFQQGRNFNFPPYSVGDTSICYYFDSHPLSRGEKRSFGFTLSLNSESGFNYTRPNANMEIIRDLPNSAESLIRARAADDREQDLVALKELMDKIDAHMLSGAISDEELSSIELALNRLRAKYSPVNPR